LKKTDHNVKGEKDRREGSSGDRKPKRPPKTPSTPKEKDELAERREKVKTLLGGLPMLQALTGNKYGSLQECFANIDEQTLIAWLKKYDVEVFS